MSSFTTRLKEAIEYKPDNVSRETWIGLDDFADTGQLKYPIFEEGYRAGLNRKIIRHYWNFEIGHETISDFRMQLNNKMWEIMPMYNQLYLSAQLTFDPLKTINIETLVTGTTTQTVEANTQSLSNADTTGTTGSKAQNVGSDTPQTMLSDDEDYASSGAFASSETTATNSADTTGSDSTDSTAEGEQTSESVTSGYSGNLNSLLADFRANIINVDMMIIRDLRELFMLIWNSSDSVMSNYRKGYND